MTQHKEDRPSQTALIAPLQNALAEIKEPVRLTFDATLSRPLRMRDSTGVKLPPDAHETMTDVIAAIDAYLQPLRLHFLKAELPPCGPAQGPWLDGSRLKAVPSLLFAYASTSKHLQGVDIQLRPGLSIKAHDGASRDIDTRFDARITDAGPDDAQLTEAASTFARWAGDTWARCVGSTLAPWVLASGIDELRLRGTIRPDLRQQLAAVGIALNAGFHEA